MRPTNQFATYATRAVGPGGKDQPGGLSGVYATIQYALNDWLTAREKRLVVLAGPALTLSDTGYTTMPPDLGSVTTGYRVIEGDVSGARPDVNLNCGGFYPANASMTHGWAIRWLALHGLGNVPSSSLPGGNKAPRAPIHHGFSDTFLVEGVDVDGVFNTQTSGNAGFLGYNQGNGDYSYNGTWNQCRLTNCGCNTSASGGDTDTSRNAAVYLWGGENFTVTNCSADVWAHFIYMKGETSPPENITAFNNQVSRNKLSDSALVPAFYFAPLSTPRASPGGLYWHHNLVEGCGTAFSAANYNTVASGPQGNDVQIYNNTVINCTSLFEVNDATGIQIYANVHVPVKNGDAMCGITRPPTGGMMTRIILLDRNAYYSGLGFSANAWQIDRYGSPQYNFGSLAAWQKAKTTSGTSELLTDPDGSGLVFPDLNAAFNNFAAGDYTPKIGGPIYGLGCYVLIGQTWE